MKKRNFILISFLIFLFISSVSSQQNQVTIRNDRVILLNGSPYFPIGMMCERGASYFDYNNEEINNGFNFINLWSQDHFLHCVSSYNIISGDLTTGDPSDDPYKTLLNAYWGNITWQANAQRLFNYNLYYLADDYCFWPDYVDRYQMNYPSSCEDNIDLTNNKFTQSIRNASVDRVVSLSNTPGNKIMGFYTKDELNLFEVGPTGNYTYYYDTYYSQAMQNYYDTYSHIKSVYPNSLVFMNIATAFFPRIFLYPNQWANTDVAREAWINEAIQYVQAGDVLYCPSYLQGDETHPEYQIYDNVNPAWYPNHIQNTIFGRVLQQYPNKAAFGGFAFGDGGRGVPKLTDPNALAKIKWGIYIGLQKGCTGLIFWGIHNVGSSWQEVNNAWNCVKTIVNEMVNTLHLDQYAFTKTNMGQIEHTAVGFVSDEVSYAVYQQDGWNDYYLLVTNNPRGNVNDPPEPDNVLTITADPTNIDWSNKTITELFSNQDMTINNNSFQFTIHWFGTAMFHIHPPNKETPTILKPIISGIPKNFNLYQNYPNPFNPSTKIKFDLPKSGLVSLDIIDIQGKLIKKIYNNQLNAGTFEYDWNAINMPSGIYFCRIIAGDFTDTKKMILLK